MIVKGFTLSLKPGDNFCKINDGKVIQIHNIVNYNSKVYILGKYYKSVKDAYTYPVKSSLLGIEKLSKLSSLKAWPADLFVKKCYFMPDSVSSGISVPILHDN